MIRTGIIGDVARLMPIFEGFDQKPEVDMSPDAYMTDDESDKIENVKVPLLPDEKYKSSKEKPSDTIGAAGNSLVADEPEPQLGSIGGIGGGLKLNESAEEMMSLIPQFLTESDSHKATDFAKWSGYDLSGLSLDDHSAMLGIIESRISTLTEADESMVIDDSSMKQANKIKEKNSIERAKEFFEDFDMFRPKVNPQFSIDTTKMKPTTSDEPIRRIPKGW